MEFKIRPVRKSDYSDLIEMFKEFATFQQTPERMVNSVAEMEKEAEFLNGFVVETASGTIAGYATWFFAYFTWIGKSVYMDDLYVKPEYRGNGLGQKLINSVIQKAKQENCKRVHWQVSKWNKSAIGFYKKLGAVVDDVELNCDYLMI
ncbi:GNAT family N-acetyltransferase [Maribellus comscasis]|uniref:GNAT family N-acetyltransferase n=1 Tax=Maribellus comscasis TaxID=2681766 RepID=A0A6I6JNR7_9BACT|nr:GNAT family N-acetyltransferase [Maribellus comscasis]QGY42620.1 GNAT family N-acetyltransferase [Maribellus comscasis]